MNAIPPGLHKPEPPSHPRPETSPGPITEEEAETYIHGICFKTGPPRRIGAELEWLVHDPTDPTAAVDPARIAAALADLPAPPPPAAAETASPTAAETATGTSAGKATATGTDTDTGTAANDPRTTAPPSAPASRPTALPAGALLTREPGGQVELSSLPAESLSQCVESLQQDLHTLRAALRRHGLVLSGYGHDPWRPPRRTLDLPRYAAMEEFFDRLGPAGRSMMCSTASVQVCLDVGTEDLGPTGYARRWRLAHLLGPVLVAAFANSPLLHGHPSGWRSTRQAVWSRLDPSRTLAPPGRDPRAAWTSYALDAALLCVRRDHGRPWSAPPGISFRDWINASRWDTPTRHRQRHHRPHGHDPHPVTRGDVSMSRDPARHPGPVTHPAPTRAWGAPPDSLTTWHTRHPTPDGVGAEHDSGEDLTPERPPTAGDLAYHLTTLFPPVRPQGHLELRMIDAQPGPDGWIVPLAVITALFEDREAMRAAEHATGRLTAPGPPAPRNPLWLRAARHGLTDPLLRRAAQTCFTAVEAALPRLGAPLDVQAVVTHFAERYVHRGRCPADDLLDAVRAHPHGWKETFPC